jgi:DNA-directed RNA polymerase subunit RPC12/RpoP
MKTLQEHNADVIQQHKEEKEKSHLSGVACPECGIELEFINPWQMLMSYPPKKSVKCPKCGYNGYMIM